MEHRRRGAGGPRHGSYHVVGGTLANNDQADSGHFPVGQSEKVCSDRPVEVSGQRDYPLICGKSQRLLGRFCVHQRPLGDVQHSAPQDTKMGLHAPPKGCGQRGLESHSSRREREGGTPVRRHVKVPLVKKYDPPPTRRRVFAPPKTSCVASCGGPPRPPSPRRARLARRGRSYLGAVQPPVDVMSTLAQRLHEAIRTKLRVAAAVFVAHHEEMHAGQPVSCASCRPPLVAARLTRWR